MLIRKKAKKFCTFALQEIQFKTKLFKHFQKILIAPTCTCNNSRG